MIRRQALLSDLCDLKRRKLNSYDNTHSLNGLPTDTEGALKYLKSLFPVEKFENRLPPIIMKHQIYAFVKNRTEVDKHLNEKGKNNDIRMFKIGQNDDQVAIVYLKDYKEHVEKYCTNNEAVANFMNVVLDCPDISFSKSVLTTSYSLREENITELIQQGVLCARDVGSYWLSVPRIGEFVKTFLYGRRSTLQYVRRTKYKEILKSELMQRKLPRKCLLGIQYHVYDIIGNELVTRIETATGTVLRLQQEIVNNR